MGDKLEKIRKDSSKEDERIIDVVLKLACSKANLRVVCMYL